MLSRLNGGAGGEEAVGARGDAPLRIAGLGVLVLGIWGGIVPFVGPLFGYPMGGMTQAWVWSESHATLHVAAAVPAVIGGALLLGAPRRGLQRLGAALAILGGAWFVIGPSLHPLWQGGAMTMGGGMMGGGMTMGGMGHISTVDQVLRPLGYHYGTGILIAGLGAVALGMLLARRPTARAPEREAALAGAGSNGHRAEAAAVEERSAAPAR